APIIRHHDVDVHNVDAVGIGRVHLYFGIVLALRIGTVALFPGGAVVGRAVEAAAALRPLHLRINDAGIRRRIVEADAPEVAGGEAAADLGPGVARIDGTPQPALGAAVDHSEIAPLALVRGRQQDLRIPR